MVLAMSSLTLSLAGCDTFPFTLATGGSGEVAAAPAVAPPPPPHKPSPPVPAMARLPEPPAAPEPAAPTAGFDRLIGLDPSHLTAVLGEPRQRAEAPPATIWRYIGQACELDVYFYFEVQSQAMRALHYEVRSHESREQTGQQCYDELVSQRRARAEPAASPDSSR